MELVEHLISTVSEYLPQDRVREIQEAYEFAANAHSGQTRKSGEDFITSFECSSLFSRFAS